MNVVSSSDLDKAGVDAVAIRLLADVLYVEPSSVKLNVSFVDLGLDSILAIEYIAQLKARLGVDISLAELYELGTPDVLLSQLRAGGNGDPS